MQTPSVVLFLYTRNTCLGFFEVSWSTPSRRLCLVATYPLWWVDSTLRHASTYRAHDKGMKSVGAEGAYCDGRCHSTVRLRIFSVRVRTAANISQEFLENEEACTLDAGSSAEKLLGSSHVRFGCAVSSLSPQNQKTVRDPHLSLFFVFRALPV